MHPILSNVRRLTLYLLVWIPLCALLVAVVSPGHLTGLESLLLCVPLCLFYAFICLAAWYICRSLPIREGRMTRLITTQALNAVIGGGLWVLLAKLLTHIMNWPDNKTPGILQLIFGMGVLFYLLSVSVYYVLFAVEASQIARQRENEARILASKAELTALRAQINPHFLYNCLNSISALTTINPAKARQMCIELSEFLRNTLGMSDQGNIPLQQEVELVRRYLSIEHVRFGSRLSVEENIAAECLNDMVPALILQPLVENAIVHGISGLVETGLIHIKATHTATGHLSLVIENTFDPEAKRTPRTGFGLAGVRKRLNVLYGTSASLRTMPAAEKFRVEIVLPAPKS